MQINEYKKMADMEEYYWWHVGRKHIVKRRLESLGLPKNAKILNVGCGTGGMAATLGNFGEIFNVDTSEEALSFSKSRGIKNLIKTEGIELPFGNNTFDAVVSLDVIEHIEKDDLAINEWKRVLKPGGVIFLTAPAYQWLWSEHDEALYHHRRYLLKNLVKLSSGFDVIKKSYLIFFTLPLIVIYRLLKKMLPNKTPSTSYVILPPFLNNALVFFLKIESYLLNYISFPFGTSILLIARKVK